MSYIKEHDLNSDDDYIIKSYWHSMLNKEGYKGLRVMMPCVARFKFTKDRSSSFLIARSFIRLAEFESRKQSDNKY